MAFLTSIASYLTTAVLSALGGWLLKVFHNWYTDVSQNQQAASQSDDSVQPLKNADPNDGTAIDKASDSALGGF